MIFDEILTGFGRTGEMSAIEHSDVTPDAITLGKSLGGIGLPLSAVVYREELDTWDPGGHLGTFRGNVPAIVGGLRAIEYIEHHDFLAHARDLGALIRNRLEELAEDYPAVGEVRGEGLFIGVEFVDADGNSDGDIVDAIRTNCYQQGVLVWSAGRGGGVLRLIPPLVVTREQVKAGLEIISEAIVTETQAQATR